MRDLKLTALCNHIIIDELLTIDGSTPNFLATLKYDSNGDKSKIIVRDLYETDGMTNFNALIDGITDFTLTGSKVLTFNQNMGYLENYLDGLTGWYPEKEYVASYIAKDTDCPKCLGSNQLTDISFDAVGKIKLVDGFEYIKQKVVKSLITSKGNNDFAPDYGSNLVGSIGKPNLAFIMLNIQQSIFETLNNIIQVQQSFIDTLVPADIIIGVEDLVIMPGSDPRELKTTFNIVNSLFDKIKVSFNLVI